MAQKGDVIGPMTLVYLLFNILILIVFLGWGWWGGLGFRFCHMARGGHSNI